MNDSQLKDLITSLEATRASQDCWLLFWTSLVVLGVILEVGFVVHEFWHERTHWRQGAASGPARPSWTKFILEVLAAALVAVGVAGELYVGAQSGRVETKIREANDNRATLLQQEAGQAKASAESASAAANQAKVAADGVAKTADAAERKMKGLSEQADFLRDQIQEDEFFRYPRKVQHTEVLIEDLARYK